MTEITENLVSTIIPVFNRSDFLIDSVHSVLSQTYRPIEIIISDDGSTDGTLGVARHLSTQHPAIIKVLSNHSQGPGPAREAGRQRAKGEFIQYLDSDDLLMPCKFEWQVAGLIENPHCAVSYGKTRFYRLGDVPSDSPWKLTGEKIDTMFPSFLKSRWWGTSTPLYRRNVIDEAGPWTPLINEEDWEYDCRIASKGVNLHYCHGFVSDQRDHTGERLSQNGSIDRKKLADRAKAHYLIYQHAQRAGIDHKVPEMRYFARELFLLCRQCGAGRLDRESQILFCLSKKASGMIRMKGWDYRIYSLLAKIFGWVITGKAACLADRLRI